MYLQPQYSLLQGRAQLVSIGLPGGTFIIPTEMNFFPTEIATSKYPCIAKYPMSRKTRQRESCAKKCSSGLNFRYVYDLPNCIM